MKNEYIEPKLETYEMQPSWVKNVWIMNIQEAYSKNSQS